MGKSVEVQGTEVSILTRDNKDYISLTDMVKAKDGDFFISDDMQSFSYNFPLFHLEITFCYTALNYINLFSNNSTD